MKTPLLLVVPWCLACPSAPRVGDREALCAVMVSTAGNDDALLEGSGACRGTHAAQWRVATGDPAAPTWTDAGVTVGGAWTAQGALARRTVVLTNTTSADVSVAGLEWTIGFVSTPAHRMLHNGYQSWSYTGIEPVPVTGRDKNGTAPHGGDNGHELEEVEGVSWWVTAVADEDDDGIVVGAGSARVFKSYVGVDAQRLRLVTGVTGDALTLGPGETREIDGPVVVLGDVRSGLEQYAAAVAAAGLPPRRTPLGGWGSWNFYYADITAAELRAEMAWAAQELLPRGLDTLLLDDGYPPRWGDWEASAAFGADLGALAAEQTALGLVPALWLAPFLVDESAAIVTAHPDWFVHDGAGALQRDTLLGGQRVVYVDMTHADARAHVTARMRALYDAGFNTFKIDFLYGGAMEGRRSAQVTSVEAYAEGLRAIREAVPDVHLVGCGAPLLPSVGWVDSMRTGPDIAFTVSPGPRYAFYAAQARHTALRAFTDAWWSLDPDVLILRGAVLTDEEAWTATVSMALAGGNYLLGDGRQADPRRVRMALDPAILALAREGRAARPLRYSAELDPEMYAGPLLDLGGQTAVPHVWEKSTLDGGTHWLAVFGWARADYAYPVTLPDGAVELLPPVDTQSLVTTVPAVTGTVSVPLHGVRVFRW